MAATATVMFNGSLYTGELIRMSPTRLFVKFTTGTGTTRESWFKTVTRPTGTLVGRRTGGVRRFGRAHTKPVLPPDAVTIPANSGFVNEERCHHCTRPYHGAVNGPCAHCGAWVKLGRS